MKTIVPCANCGGELYDRVVKYHMRDGCVQATQDKCFDFAHWSYGSYCPHCHTQVAQGKDLRIVAAERVVLFGA